MLQMLRALLQEMNQGVCVAVVTSQQNQSCIEIANQASKILGGVKVPPETAAQVFSTVDMQSKSHVLFFLYFSSS